MRRKKLGNRKKRREEPGQIDSVGGALNSDGLLGRLLQFGARNSIFDN